MKNILFSHLLLISLLANAQQDTPWGYFADPNEMDDYTYYKIFDGIPQINGTNLAIGDMVAALNNEGALAGYFEITELVGGQIPVFTLQIFQDAPSTSVDEGVAGGEMYTIQYYDASTAQYYRLGTFGPWTTASQQAEAADGDDPNQSFWNATFALAIDLIEFNGVTQDNEVLLKWASLAEKENDFYTIEKSKDGVHFSVLGTVRGAGTTNEKQNYELVDTNPYQGINYYRLSSTDFYGKTAQHSTIALTLEADEVVTSINLFPNPVSDVLNVEFSSHIADNDVQIQVLDMAGRLLKEEKADLSFSNIYSLSVKELPAGTYMLKVVGKTFVDNQKITVK